MKHELFLKLEIENLTTGELTLRNAMATVIYDSGVEQYGDPLIIESLIDEKTGEPILIGAHERNQICDKVADLRKAAKEGF